MSGIERKIDKLGRLVLPISYREALGLTENSKVTVHLDNGVISIIPTEEECLLCGKNENLNRALHICESCIEKVKNTT